MQTPAVPAIDCLLIHVRTRTCDGGFVMHSSASSFHNSFRCVALVTVLSLAACGGREPRARHRARRGDARGADRIQLSGCRRRLLSRHGRRPDADAGADPGAQHVDRLDRRQRPALGRALGPEPRIARLSQDALVASDAPVLPRYALELSRARQRTVFPEGDRPRPEPLRSLARRPRPGLSP